MDRVVIEFEGRFYVAYVDLVDDFGRTEDDENFDPTNNVERRISFFPDGYSPYQNRTEAERSARGDCHICGASGGH
jgi:hypothetical protein